ncbi:hypothetical protein MMAS_11830 [Mycobacteroides abscessus subsp. massiliense CCUG 48898 = JCM 15300]|nr:hypothetical protein MMAS_11830 [Mycobacteroides abscessus subsp. massiliense CCUG 48898 = JCM 15300]
MRAERAAGSGQHHRKEESDKATGDNRDRQQQAREKAYHCVISIHSRHLLSRYLVRCRRIRRRRAAFVRALSRPRQVGRTRTAARRAARSSDSA